MPEVSVVRSPEAPKSYEEVKNMVRRAIDLLGGIDKFINRTDTVLIKPNTLLPLPPEKAVTTDPRVVQATAEIVKERVKEGRVVVGDIPRLKLRSRDVLKTTGIEGAARKAGVEVAYLDEDVQIEVSIPNATVLGRTRLPKIVLDADAVIYLPKLKTHYISGITAAIKSAHGLQITEDRAKYHRQDLNHKLVDLLRVVKPTLTVVDAILSMEGQGPVVGRPVQLNVIVAGNDAVAVDTVCASIMGFDPFEIPTTRIAYWDGLGEADLSKITIKGNSIEEVKRNFRRCDRTIEGVHPKIETFVGGTCPGCQTSSRGFIDMILDRGWAEKLDKLSIITGLDVNLAREPSGEIVFVLGDCAKNHADKGIFIPGCIPFDTWTVGIATLEEYLKKKGRLQ